MRPRRRVNMGKRTVLMIDPPGGWHHGFPKPCPTNWALWSWEEKKLWFIDNNYPKSKLTEEISVSLYHEEVEETWLAGRANI